MFTLPINKKDFKKSELIFLHNTIKDDNFMDRFKTYIASEYNYHIPTKKIENDRKINILYVDDDKSNLTGFKATFRHAYNVYVCTNVEDALNILSKKEIDIDIVLSDSRMPDTDGVTFLKLVKKLYPNISRLLISGYSDATVLVDAINLASVTKFIQKPWTEEDMHNCILAACPPIN